MLLSVACRPPGATDGSSFEVSQLRCSELEEQVEQQQKVIRFLQAQLEGSKGPAPGPHQQLQAEVAQLKQQLAALQLGAAGAGGGGSTASALQQQVLLLQVGGRWFPLWTQRGVCAFCDRTLRAVAAAAAATRRRGHLTLIHHTPRHGERRFESGVVR